MKNQTLRIAATIFAFAGLLLSIACSPGTPPANQANVQSANSVKSANADPAAANASKSSDACDQGTTQDKVDALNAKIDQRFKDDPKFKAQYAPDNNGVPTFRFWVVNNNGIIELLVKGKISGKNKDGNSKLEGILDIIDGFLDKTSCIQKVKLIPGVITSQNDPAPTTSAGFEWIFCESPQVACSGGRCMDDPPGCAGVGNGNMNSNAPGNSNHNTGSNTVSNANRP